MHQAWTATIRRISAQLRNDPRTIALVILMPLALVTLLYWVFHDVPVPQGAPHPFDRVGPIILVVLPMALMFIVTSVVMLRERTSGTLERILTTPLSRWNLIVSYGIVFGVLALLQVGLLLLVMWSMMGLEIEGSWAVLVATTAVVALFGVAFGLLASAFAHTEFQAVQFMPLFVAPQLFLCGLFVAKEDMPKALEVCANLMPMTWAVDITRNLTDEATLTGASWGKLALLTAIVLAALLLASITIRRKTK
ncbi:ABC transporter permease [Gleimia hominis]|uniref:Transport permease protein n=1 Tax=Gleimia hominis TaxID=595468 RepID=A0ABU3I916_9ACTO|nr:ABC transporter permease [Gleimia hominis]MDT3766864.1 ABC transporter permease [Gleimia hominis]